MEKKKMGNYKVILLGDANVGKSCLYEKLVSNSPTMDPDTTIGAVYHILEVSFRYKGTKLKRKVEIWDTAGQERFRSIVNIHYRDALGALIVYDITKERSFRNLTNWLENLRGKNDKNVVVGVIGNKLDLSEKDRDSRRVEYSRVLQFTKSNKIYSFEETSAFFDKEDIFTILRDLVVEMYRRHEIDFETGINENKAEITFDSNLSSLRGSFNHDDIRRRTSLKSNRQKKEESSSCC